MIVFGFCSTLILYMIFRKFKKIPPIITTGLSLILILKIFHIDYETYYKSAKIFSFLIAPATISLAYPLYKNSHILIQNKRAIYPAIIMATLLAIVSTYFLANFFGAQFEVTMSMMAKSTTMPIAIEITKSLGGYCELCACIVAITGVLGGVLGHFVLKHLKVRNDVAIGLALGSASHVIGSAACSERKKERQVTASTIALILVGLLSAIIIPALKNLF